MGLRVVCVDSRQAPLDLVKKLKFAPVMLCPFFIFIECINHVSHQDFAIDATKGVDHAIAEIGGNVDAVLMATDSIPAHEYGLQLVRKHGTFVVIGL